MDPAAAAGRHSSQRELGAGRLFLTDSRLVLAILNSARYRVLQHLFGVSREQANLVTFMAALVAADGVYESARRIVRTPLGGSGPDVLVGGGALREVAFTIGRPRSREVPLFATLVGRSQASPFRGYGGRLPCTQRRFAGAANQATEPHAEGLGACVVL